MQAPIDPGFNGQHYLPWTLRTTPRDPIPDKNQLSSNWVKECQDQAGAIWNLYTPSGLSFSLVSSCMQGAIRQGKILESMQWSLEMLATDAQIDAIDNRKVGKGESNLLHRLCIIAAEDISLANPRCLVAMAEVMRNKFTYNSYADAQRAYMSLTIMLARSQKSRAVDWACICRINVSEPFDVVVYYNKLIENLLTGQHVNAIGYAEGFITASLKDKEAKIKDGLSKLLFEQLSRGVTHRGKPLKFYKNKRQILWTAIMRVCNHLNQNKQYPVVTEIVESCYDLAHDNAFRWKVEARLFGRMAIMTLCLKDAIESRGLDFRNGPIEEFPNSREFTFEEIEQLRLSHRNGNLWYGVPDVCKDKHNLLGKQLGRGIQHFIEVKAFLRHEDPQLTQLSDFYLKLAFQTRYSQGGSLFDRSGMTIPEYIEWLPELRQRFNQLNRIEDAILKSVITITFCDRGESHVGMQMLGQLAPEGFTCVELMQIGQNFSAAGIQAEIYDLRDALNNHDIRNTAEEACILILRNAARIFTDNPDKAFLELLQLNWDSKALMKGKVCNKKARWNLCFANFSQEPNYEEGKGRVYDLNSIACLKSITGKLGRYLGPKGNVSVAEGNYYYDKHKCYIGPHGDSERRIVIAFRFGATMTLEYQWYQRSLPIGTQMVFKINHGDVYIMSQKSVGTDWKQKIIPTLRHSANAQAANQK